MQYLKRARDLAQSRGYLADPVSQDWEARIPGWFRALGTEAGLAEFEARNDIRVPLAVREFYRDPQLACFLELATDGEYFLNSMADLYRCEMPPIFEQYWGRVLVVAFHCHSGMCLGVELTDDDPKTIRFFDDEKEYESGLPPVPEETFSQLIFDQVQVHEQRQRRDFG